MAHVEDRWTAPGPTGKRVRTDRWGRGSRWLAVWVEPDGRRRKRAFDTRDAADDHLAQVRTHQLSGTYITRDRGAVTVAAMSAEWTASHPEWSVSTRARNESILRRHVLPRWGSVALDMVREEDVQAWVNQLPGAVGTRRRIHQVLSGVLTLAVRRKRLPANPAAGAVFPPSDAKRMRPMTVREVDAFVAAHPSYLRTWARFLAYTGLRVSEAAGLRVGDVDLERRRVAVREAIVVVDGRKVEQDRLKTRASRRIVPLYGELVDDLRVIATDRAPEERLFLGRNGATMNRANYSRRTFRAAAAAVGRPGMTPHELRHTAVSLAVAAGGSVMLVQAIAGHSDPSVTLGVYSHLFEDELDTVAARAEAFLAAARQPPQGPQIPSATG